MYVAGVLPQSHSVQFLFFLFYTHGPYHSRKNTHVPEHSRGHRMSWKMQAFYAVKLPCSGTFCSIKFDLRDIGCEDVELRIESSDGFSEFGYEFSCFLNVGNFWTT